MTNRRTLSISIFAAAILALCLPVLAAAQGGYGYPDYGRNRNGNYGRYDERYLRDSIHRLDRLAKDFERDLDRALDRSRVNGTTREDRINAQGHDFRRAVSNLKSAYGNGRDLNRRRDEAQRVLQESQQFNRLGRYGAVDNRVASEWSQIQQELNVIADAYGLGFGRHNNGGYYPNYPNGRNYPDNNRNRNNNDWWRRIPWPN
jgi:ABC-type transporter Mla subunit MlaD